MSLSRHFFTGTASSAYALAVSVLLMPAAATASEKVLHKFLGGHDGSIPQAGLIVDGSGIFFGTTAGGGGGTNCDTGGRGCGTVYKITPKGKESILYAFVGGCDGALPFGGVLMNNQGTLYGTTGDGGTCGNDGGYGTVFKLTPSGAETVLYAFQGTTDGAFPSGNLVSDVNGDLFGTTSLEGDMSACGGEGCGTVFEVTPSGDETVIYAFQGGTDGANPLGGLISDGSGNFYGTTQLGGSTNCTNSCGTVFKVSGDGTETILHEFQGGSDGFWPSGGVIADSAANLYGTTEFGGSNNEGTVFKLSPGGTETVLYSFKANGDGAVPEAGVVMDRTGNLYGTTYTGGSSVCRAYGGCGTVWKLTPGGQETVLYAFHPAGGHNSSTPLLLTGNGTLYGTTVFGGIHSNGVVFKVKP